MKNSRFSLITTLVIAGGAAMILPGCRTEESYREERKVKTSKVFREIKSKEYIKGSVLTLDECISFAVQNNLSVKVANMEQDVAERMRAADLLAMTMSIYAKKQQAIKNKKKLGAVDERFLREGESLLFGELGVDYIDYYLLHSIGGGDGMPLLRERFFDNGVLDFLVQEREKGRIRHLGWSFHGDVAVFDYMLSLHDEGKYRWDFVQIQMNYLDWRHAKATNERNINAEYLYGELEKRGIPCTIMEPLLGGRLSNVPDHVAEFLKTREPDRSVASWAFRFCGTYPGVLSVLSGMTYMEHLQDNLTSLAPLKPLTEDDLEYLQRAANLMAAYPTIPCNQCNYCMPCPYGLDIPNILTFYNKCINEGNMPDGRQDPNYRKARRAFLVGYSRAVPSLRQADHCTGCNQCSPECPQRIDIPAELRKIDSYAEQLRQDNF